MMMMMNGMGGGQNEPAPTEISGILRVELMNLENMPKDEIWKLVGKVLDAVRDAGGAVGPSASDMQMARWYGRMQPNTMVKFVLSDLKPLREQSYERAVADARARGDRLARLSGTKLAGVAAVHETQIPGDGPDQNRNPYMWGWNDTGGARVRTRRDRGRQPDGNRRHRAPDGPLRNCRRPPRRRPAAARPRMPGKNRPKSRPRTRRSRKS